MERLVVDLEKFNFQQTNKPETTQNRGPLTDNRIHLYKSKFEVNNCFPNMSIRCDEQMPENKIKPFLNDFKEHDDDDDNDETSSASSISVAGESDGGGNADSEDETIKSIGSFSQTRKNAGSRYHEVRKMPDRANKRKLHGASLRTPMKPQKLTSRCPSTLKISEIKKIYTNQKLTKFRPTSLETIFEEPQPIRGFMSGKKLRRALVCKDGQNTNKTLVKQRRARIKKNLGTRTIRKKIPLQNFLNYMQEVLNSENENDEEKTSLHTLNEINEVEMKPTGETEIASKTENVTDG